MYGPLDRLQRAGVAPGHTFCFRYITKDTWHLSLLSIAVIKHYDQKQHGEEKDLDHLPSIMKGKAGSTELKPGPWRQEMKQNHGGVLLTSLLLMSHLTCCFIPLGPPVQAWHHPQWDESSHVTH